LPTRRTPAPGTPAPERLARRRPPPGTPAGGRVGRLADRLTALGEQHAGVHRASIGWILPLLHDPDGHEVRFYTYEHHTEPEPGKVTTIHDPRENSERRERATA
jgi:hypothetical protein